MVHSLRALSSTGVRKVKLRLRVAMVADLGAQHRKWTGLSGQGSDEALEGDPVAALALPDSTRSNTWAVKIITAISRSP
jgi:hypothetical protein